MNDDFTIRNGLEVHIQYDEYADSPIEWAGPEDRAGRVTYALKHSGYSLPYEVDADTADFDSWHALAEAVTAKGGELPGFNYKFVRWHEHGGIAVSLRDSDDLHDWDSGCAGVIFGKTTADIEAEFKPYAAYIEGEVYSYYTVNPKSGEVIDSCGGFYGADDVTEAANEAADNYIWPADAAYAKNAKELHR